VIVDRCKGCGFCIAYCPGGCCACPPVSTRRAITPRGRECTEVRRLPLLRGPVPGVCHLRRRARHDNLNVRLRSEELSDKAVLTGTWFMNGDHACCEGPWRRGAVSLPAIPSRPPRKSPSACPAGSRSWAASTSRWRMNWPPWRPSSGRAGGREGHDEHLRSGLLPHDGKHRPGHLHGDPLRGLQRPAGRSQHGPAHARGSGDMMQARWGSHGHYEIIALSPSSPQEMFDFTIGPSTSASSTGCP